jgi:2-polyprenyl-3-methyl-5-hydroxy-6-metoxy-1,4-benzoquinol methylase
MESSQIEKVKKEYEEFADKYAAANFHNPLQYQLSEFCSLLPKEEKSKIKILDVGCGPGRDVEYLMEEGYDILGIDFSEEMIKVAKKLVPNGKFEVADFTEKDFDEDSFSGIWCNAALLHIPKEYAKNIFAKFLKWLKPGGILFISMLEGEGQQELWIKRFYQNPLTAYFYRLNELIQELEETGFEIVKYHNEYDFDNNWIDVFCRKPE